jgi:hypothetical protein
MAVVRQRANSLISPQNETAKPGCNVGAMVCSGNPPYGHTPPATPDRACPCDRLIRLATSASGGGASLTPHTKGVLSLARRLVLVHYPHADCPPGSPMTTHPPGRWSTVYLDEESGSSCGGCADHFMTRCPHSSGRGWDSISRGQSYSVGVIALILLPVKRALAPAPQNGTSTFTGREGSCGRDRSRGHGPRWRTSSRLWRSSEIQPYLISFLLILDVLHMNSAKA